MVTRKIKITNESVVKYQQATIDDAVLQAIYNSIDAGADEITLQALTREDLTLKLDDENATLDNVLISDNGCGIPFGKLDEYFQQLERSWKKDSSPSDRAAYHGSKGCGRFKGFAIGEVLQWKTVYRDKSGKLMEYTMQLDVASAKDLKIIEEPRESTSTSTGTALRISRFTKKFLKQFNALDELEFDVLTGLLVDIEVYKKHVNFFGKILDPEPLKAKEGAFSYSYLDNDGVEQTGDVRILAWKSNVQFVDHKHTFYYRANGAFFDKKPSGAYADTHYPPHTLIVRSATFDKYSEVEAGFNVYDKIERAIRPQVVAFLTQVKNDEFSGTLQEIFDSDDYPYKGTPVNALEEAKMTVYNAVLGALVFENSGVVTPKRKQLLKVIFPLLNKLLSGDVLLGENIDSILELDSSSARNYNRMVTRLKLSKIVDRYNRLMHRYDFLEVLGRLVHCKEYSEELLERAQLHKILAEEVWVLGEEFEQENLVTSDKSINTFIREHANRTDLIFDVAEDADRLERIEEFIHSHQGELDLCLQKIPDLVLAKHVKVSGGDGAMYLVIELKRPTVLIDKECREQARKVYAGISSGTNGGGLKIDPQHKWRYCLLSAGVSPELDGEFGGGGHLEEKADGNYIIDVLTWDTVIEEARKRLDEEMDGISVEIADADCQELLRGYKTKFGVRSAKDA